MLETLGLEDMNTDAAVPGLNRNNAYRLIVPKVPDVLLLSFDCIVGSLRTAMRENKDEIQSLISLRDTLLPRLISGQLRIPE